MEERRATGPQSQTLRPLVQGADSFQREAAAPGGQGCRQGSDPLFLEGKAFRSSVPPFWPSRLNHQGPLLGGTDRRVPRE